MYRMKRISSTANSGSRAARSPAGAAAPRILRIGELAARTGRSVHTIRWYEAQGLMPGIARDSGGRRLYNERHVAWLDLIARLRLTGMSIAQMREYAGLVKAGDAATLRRQRALLNAHRDRVRDTIAEWTAALQLLDRKLEFYDTWLATGKRPREKPAVPASARPNGRAGRHRAA